MQGECTYVYKILVKKAAGKRLLGRPKCKWEDNIKKVVTRIGCEGMDWIHMAQYRNQWQALMNMVMIFRFHKRWEIS
jgi:hypothetical protein